ncbi:EAL domain-containing protein [Sulfuriflexus sp.]|uniref:two-component system response regulator n=1 Tax=Sulfuriflexus sp. TaxID=2015443 RepID=UPI0028CC0B95|nr:EAL domain-containing protein [Sulfuriflexus sp.]MDT8404568.1 EAL domain-containing protein [Sulfuriflexus sp.]
MLKSIRILIVEDSDDDTELLLRELRKGGFDPVHQRVETMQDMQAALQASTWDIIISDYSMPHFDGIGALKLAKSLEFDLPFIIVSANIGEEIAVMAMKAGAHDYIMKGNLARLVPAIERELKEAKLRHSHRESEKQMQQLSSAVEQTADAVTITDAEGNIEYVNAAFSDITGFSKQEAIGQSCSMLKSGRHNAAFYAGLWQSLTEGHTFQDIFINRRKDGNIYYEEKSITPLKDEKGKVTHFISTGKDITEQMATRQRLHHLSSHDGLTDLPNRSLFIDRLSQAISRARWNGRVVAVLFIDLDRFKNINETLGFEYGDSVLQAVASRLTQNVRDGDTVARLGDDEFAILLEDIYQKEDIPVVVEKIIKSLSQIHIFDEHELFVTTAMGISLYPSDGDDAQTLIQNADVAIHHAKESGSNNYRFYESKMNTQSLYRLNMESSLGKALEREEFFLLYQPQINLKSGQIIGFEALLRWQHPELGTVSPVEFIPLLEETGMINQVGRWVLRTACQACRTWNEMGLHDIKVSVNMSPVQFDNDNISHIVADALSETWLEAKYLEIELTESTIMRSPQKTISVLDELNAMGVTLAIDDFGTGYSSLSYLQKFPIDVLKIDRFFVKDVSKNNGGASIVNAIISMAHSLKMSVVAEGVEDNEQLAFLQEHDCEMVQGFLFSKPVPHEAAMQLLKAGVIEVEKIRHAGGS